MATTKKTVAELRQEVRDLGRNVEQVSKKLLGDATHATLNLAEKALGVAQKQVQKAREQLKKS